MPIQNATEGLRVFWTFSHADNLRLLADFQFYLHNDSRFEVIGVLWETPFILLYHNGVGALPWPSATLAMP